MPTADLRENVKEAAAFLKLLANSERLMIVYALVTGEKSVSEIERAVGVRQPRLSQQLAELREAGLLAGRRDAKRVFYRIADRRAERLVAVLHDLFCAPPEGASIAQAVDADQHGERIEASPLR